MCGMLQLRRALRWGAHTKQCSAKHSHTRAAPSAHPPAAGAELASFGSSPASSRWNSEWVSGTPSLPSTCSTSLQTVGPEGR